MRISIIIPTYNAREHLAQTLRYISRQSLPRDVSLEIVVSDDGSNDGTEHIVREYARALPIVYTYRPRDELSCRARARNEGIAKSSGELLVFLDSGMLIPPFFIRKVRDAYTPMENKMLAHYMYGIFTDPEQTDLSVIDGLSPDRLEEICKRIKHNPEWLDARHGLFEWVDGELSRLPVPWTMGYSGAFTVPSHLAKAVGGFDDSFMGWGAEDNDFACRLENEGAVLYAETEAYAFHIPYVSSEWESKRKTNFANRTLLHRKQYRLDTELYRYYPGTYYNQVVARFDHLVLNDQLPDYSQALFTAVRQTVLQGAERSLLIGVDSTACAVNLPVTHLFAYNRAAYHRFRLLFPEREVHYLLGCDTPYADRYFDVIVISDLYRMLGSVLREPFMRELQRIGRKMAFICSKREPVSARLDDGPWLNKEQLVQEAIEQQLRYVGAYRGDEEYDVLLFAAESEGSAS